MNLRRLREDIEIASIIRRQRNATIERIVDRWGNSTLAIEFDCVPMFRHPPKPTVDARVRLAVGKKYDDAGTATVAEKGRF